MKVRSFLIIILGTLISALAFNIFFSPYHIVSGGLSGIAVILNFLFNMNEALVIFVLTIFLFIVGFIFLTKEEMLKSFLGSILFPLFIYLTNLFLVKMNLQIDNRLLAAIVGGVLFGFGLGIIYKEGYTTGGVDIITKILNKKFNIPFGISTFLIDLLITFIGCIVFGLEIFVYSGISIYIYSMMIDKVILGLSGNKSFYIITNKPLEVKKFIMNDLSHGVTILKGKGAYTNEERYILFVVIPTRDYYKLKDGLKNIDNKAFFVVSNSYEVGGGK